MKRTSKSLISVQRKPKRFTTSQSKVQGLAFLFRMIINKQKSKNKFVSIKISTIFAISLTK